MRDPGWHGTFLKEVQALEAERAHPIGLALHFGDLLNDLRAQSSLGLEHIIFGHVKPGSICLLFRRIYLSTHQNPLRLILCWCRKPLVHEAASESPRRFPLVGHTGSTAWVGITLCPTDVL